MIINFIKISKTAAQTAVFYFTVLFYISGYAASKPSQNEVALDTIKKKVVGLLMQKQKKQALIVIDEFISTEKNKNVLKDARDFKISVGKKFLSKEAQEFYEVSLNSTLEKPSESKKNNEDCLSLDPENYDCQVQKIRLLYRENPNKFNEKQEIDKINKYFIETDFNWIRISTEKLLPEFKNQTFFKKEAVRLKEENLIRAILEIDRAFAAKNFSKAKEVLQVVEKSASDWPDLVFFKQKIESESTENKSINATEASNLYQMKCKNLSKSIARKYRYDFDLCMRGAL
ncbi:MAG: hypothetical protein WA160_07675 [Pseudobdellovibrio sp.]